MIGQKEKEYWENRYQIGGTSGAGSVGEFRIWRWKIIEKYLREVDHVIDVGCGDLSFWMGRKCKDYFGIDISPSIIGRNRMIRPNWIFRCQDASILIPELKKPVVFCFDVLYHQMTEISFERIIRNLCDYSSDLIFIVTLAENPFLPGKGDGLYQTYRNLDDYMEIFREQGFSCIEKDQFFNSLMTVFKKLSK